MRTLYIDIETYSDVDIAKAGLYRYVQSHAFEVLLIAYALDDEPVHVLDLKKNADAHERLKPYIYDAEFIKTAHNAPFEFHCLSTIWPDMNLDQWQCTATLALFNGYPEALDAAGKALGLPEDKKKMAAGKALIRKFCRPCAPTKSNGGRTRNLPEHEPGQWEVFKLYCAQDVETERAIHKELKYSMPASERRLWLNDVRLNMRGIMVDADLISGALKVNADLTNDLTTLAKQLTGLNNPNSLTQLKGWILKETGQEVDSLNKAVLDDLIADAASDKVRDVLRIRKELGKTSVKKYDAMEAAMCEDHRVRGLLRYYGANRTGRWAGRLVQVQNLPRNKMSTLKYARQMVKDRNTEALVMLYDNPSDVLSQLIRTAFIAPEGYMLAVADFSAIEARVIAWLADEKWRLEVFRTHGKIYEASASTMFNVPIEKIKKGQPEYALRQKGKIAELALGYQGSVGALKQMGALDMGLHEDELPGIVNAWRQANSKICALWYGIEEAAMDCVRDGIPTKYKCLSFKYDGMIGTLIITLPSGRSLFYNGCFITKDARGFEKLSYHGVNQETRKWVQIPTYGGKLTENIVQAIARDCLAEKLLMLEPYDNIRPVMHIHDEIVAEVPEDQAEACYQKMIDIMREPISWAQGLPLNADGFISKYYKKD